MATGTNPNLERVHSIDVVRGALVVLLVFVEYLPPAAGEPYRWLRHSPWDGVRVADFVFPGFLVVVGASMAVATSADLVRALRRAAVLFLLGLFFNAWGTSNADLSTLRITGVLQTIGIAGLLATLVVRMARDTRVVIGVSAALLVLHGLLVTRAFTVDQWLLADDHLYRRGTAGHDPEGVLATLLGATAVVLLGWAVTRVLHVEGSDRGAAVLTAACFGTALAASTIWAPNKRQWTPSFSLLMVATVALALVALSRVRVPLLGAIGRNALLVYVGQHLAGASLATTPHDDTTLRGAALRSLGESPRALLAYAALATIAWSAVAIGLGRLGVRLRV